MKKNVEKEPLKLRIIRKLGLTTIEHTNELLAHKASQYVERENKLTSEYNKKMHDMEKEYKEKIKEVEKDLSDFKVLHEKSRKAQEDKINCLKQEIELLNNELNMLHEKYDGKYIVEKLPPVRLSKSQTMNVSHRNRVRSRIARDSAKEIEYENK